MNYLLLISLSFSIFYFLFLFKVRKGIRLLPKNIGVNNSTEFVSVIVPFKNESENIVRAIQSLEKQSYPKELLEILFINDDSIDDSISKFDSLAKSPNIKLLSVPKEFHPGKRKIRAIKYGIENANGELIVTTDCDCIHNPNWLQSMVNCFSDDTGFVSGPVKFEKNNNFTNKLQELEFAGLILTGAGLIGLNRPAICNSANIAYRKRLIELVNKPEEETVIDEFLLIKAVTGTKYKIRFCWDKDAIVETKPVENIAGFMKQRIRWATFNWLSLPKSILVSLIFIFFFYLSIPILFFYGLFGNPEFLPGFAFCFAIKSFADYEVLREDKKFLIEELSLKVFLVAEIFHIPYIIFSVISAFLFKVNWKGK